MDKVNRALVTGLMVMLINTLPAQDKSPFREINLEELKQTVLNQLEQDQLIPGRAQLVYLSLKTDGIELNGHQLPEAVSDRYDRLLSTYNLGAGPYRTILISDRCTAVGDFMENSFTGKAEGRLNLVHPRTEFQAPK